MEQDFSERLKKYRKGKGLTQQELADALDVSNKTVSRWESGGGYPDVSLLVPLARVLGVSVDDLLDGERPVRTMTKADWQCLLSFAFALGGGVLFYLLDLFMPMAVCYLAYLACMAYGVYLQKHYCYQSRWFRIGNGVMDFAVNLSMVTAAAIALAGAEKLGALLTWMLTRGKSMLPLYLAAGLAAAVTMATLLLVERYGFGNRLCPAWRPAARELFPALGMVLLTSFWALFRMEALPVVFYTYQEAAYYGLLLALALVCVLLYCRKGRRRGLVPTAVMALGGLCLPGLAGVYAWLPNAQRWAADTQALSGIYTRFGQISAPLAATGAALAALCALSVIIGLGRKEP